MEGSVFSFAEEGHLLISSLQLSKTPLCVYQCLRSTARKDFGRCDSIKDLEIGALSQVTWVGPNMDETFDNRREKVK